MERKKLVAARIRRHWTLAKAAEHLLVDINTLSRWEHGLAAPRAYNLHKICEVYEAAASELDLEEYASKDVLYIPASDGPGGVIDDELRTLVERDLTLHFISIILSWPHHNTKYHELQAQIKQATEEFCAMNDSFDERLTRRDALRRLAFLPIKFYGLALGANISASSTEEVLVRCAAGIAACESLSNSADLATAFSAISAYLPILTALLATSPRSQQAIAQLATQCLFLKTILSMHLEGIKQAMQYAQQAVEYSKKSGDLPLCITALGRQAWVYSCEKLHKPALEKALQALHLLNESPTPLSASVQSYVYGVLAKYQAFNGRKNDADLSLNKAHETFFSAPQYIEDREHAYMNHDLSNFLLDDGVTHLFMVQYQEAFQSFARIVDPHDLSARIPVAERIRLEVLNYQTLTSLKSSSKDLEQTLHFWKAGIEGARTLQSEQRFAEACVNFETIECIWPGEKRVEHLRDLTIHW